ncbi:hypothetical protein [Streptomyces sp. CMSTAAHL-2]|uniref:hypothetical protein n=1 Tax=Streptomyces sp. CMSTAAHL-2 TaxID=2904522 RepID=UPI001E44A8AA|nr:hypothetical protein [Streptomyces sp. CMSTAAHL-2]MCE3035561.1 hypothetical protein [Streptomyces sp. CMSTAAHL-2]
MLTLHGLRNLRMMVYHQCSHRNMYRRKRLDTVIGRAISSLLVIQNFERYSRECAGHGPARPARPARCRQGPRRDRRAGRLTRAAENDL